MNETTVFSKNGFAQNILVSWEIFCQARVGRRQEWVDLWDKGGPTSFLSSGGEEDQTSDLS